MKAGHLPRSDYSLTLTSSHLVPLRARVDDSGIKVWDKIRGRRRARVPIRNNVLCVLDPILYKACGTRI